MGMMINRRRVCGGKKLPYDAEIEYLEGTGTQYIDTGYKHNQDTRIITSIKKVKNSTQYYYPVGSFGGPNTGATRKLFVVEITSNVATYYRASTQNFIPHNANIVLDIDMNKNIHTINGVTKTYTADKFQSIYNTLLFQVYDYEGHIRNTQADTLMYYFKMYDNDVLVRDFIPVRIGTTGYMYDKVSKQLFGNSGTGDFILGADK